MAHENFWTEVSENDPNSVRAVCSTCGHPGPWRNKQPLNLHVRTLRQDQDAHRKMVLGRE